GGARAVGRLPRLARGRRVDGAPRLGRPPPRRIPPPPARPLTPVKHKGSDPFLRVVEGLLEKGLTPLRGSLRVGGGRFSRMKWVLGVLVLSTASLACAGTPALGAGPPGPATGFAPAQFLDQE